MTLNEICGTETSVSQKNTGGKKQCLEGAMRTYILAKGSFSFASVAAVKTKAAWDAAKQNKDIAVFYDIEELEPNNTDAVINEGRFRDYKIKDSVKGVSYTHYLSTCSHDAVKSYEDSDYTTMFRVTENNELLCEVQDDGTVKGEPITSFIVGERNDAPVDGTPSTQIQIKFDAYSLSILIPDFDLTGYEGIYDVNLSQVSATATSIRFTASTACSGSLITSLVAANIVVKNAAGEVQTVSFVAPNSDGVYEVTGTGFANGHTVELNGVIAQSQIMYEDEAPLTVSGI